jgi:hypothetical protein
MSDHLRRIRDERLDPATTVPQTPTDLAATSTSRTPLTRTRATWFGICVAAVLSIVLFGCMLQSTSGRLVIFAYHGFPWLTYRRAWHPNLQMRGFKEEDTTTTQFDMLVLNDMDCFYLVMDVIDRTLACAAALLRQHMVDKGAEHRAYVRSTGEDLPEVRN